jgi:mannosyltransferase
MEPNVHFQGVERMNRQRIVLLGIIGVGFALRVYYLGQRTIWYDEAFSFFLSAATPQAILQGTATDIQPPLYYLLLHFWQGLGGSLYLLRFLSVIFSVLCMPLVYQIARSLFVPRLAIYAMLLVAVAPFQIAYAQELRMYSLLAFSFAVFTFAFLKLINGDARWRTVLVLGLSGAVGLYSQSIAVLTWVVPDIYLLVRRDWRLLKPLLAGQLLSLVLFLPWLGVLATQWINVQHSYWTTSPGLVEIIQLFLAFTTYQPLPIWFLPIALFVTLAVVAFILVELTCGRRPSTLGLIVMLVIIPPLLMIALSYIIRSIFVVRAVILSSLAFSILMAWWLARIKVNSVRWIILFAWLVVVGVALVFQFSYDEFPRPPFKTADEYLRAQLRPGDVIVHDNKLSFFPMYYYDQTLAQVFLADPPGAGSDTLALATQQAMQLFPSSFEDATAGKSRVWFVIFQNAIDEAQGNHPNVRWMEGHYQRVATQHFNDLVVLEYQR